METIHIYHTNDIHSHLENWPRIQQFLEAQKELHQESDEEVLLFDIGDFIDRWHPYTEATMGRGNVTLLNQSEYTAVTIGNNEGINLPFEELDHLYDEAQFDVICANLYTNKEVHPSWVKPYTIYQTHNGTRVGVIGLTAPFIHLYEQLGWKITDPVDELKIWIKRLVKEADVIILLSHLGIQVDEQIASDFPEVDVILGGHTHHVLEYGKSIGETLIAAAGKHGNFVGRVTINLDDQKVVIKKEAVLYDRKLLPAVGHETELIASYLEKGKELLSDKVTTISKPLVNDTFKETEFSLLLCQALREWCKADCAMVNAGLLLGTLSGDVTEYDLLTICPHPINPCTVELTGEELETILLETRNEALHQKHIKGLGFRGTVLGVFVYDGVSIKGEDFLVGERELDPSRTYTLALPDMFTFGHFFKEVLPYKEKKYFLPEFLRDVLKWKLQLHQ